MRGGPAWVRVLGPIRRLTAWAAARPGSVGTWDADRLLQVVSNLVGNAVHHSAAGSPIRVHIQGRRDDSVVCRVHNVGAPIPEDLRGVLFEPFRSAENGHPDSHRLGLDLYITKEIVLAHGGNVSFESSEESGTCFTLTIPRHTMARESEPSGTDKDRTAGSAKVRFGVRASYLKACVRHPVHDAAWDYVRHHLSRAVTRTDARNRLSSVGPVTGDWRGATGRMGALGGGMRMTFALRPSQKGRARGVSRERAERKQRYTGRHACCSPIGRTFKGDPKWANSPTRPKARSSKPSAI